jgi:hypothetical protein
MGWAATLAVGLGCLSGAPWWHPAAPIYSWFIIWSGVGVSLLVDRTNLSMGLMVSGCERSLAMEWRFLGRLAWRARLYIAYLGQAMRKWNTVSSFPLQLGHCGDSDFPSHARCWFSGMWPVCSYIRRLACLHGRLAVSFQKQEDGTVGSRFLSWGYLLDFFRWVVASHFVWSL